MAMQLDRADPNAKNRTLSLLIVRNVAAIRATAGAWAAVRTMNGGVSCINQVHRLSLPIALTKSRLKLDASAAAMAIVVANGP